MTKDDDESTRWTSLLHCLHRFEICLRPPWSKVWLPESSQLRIVHTRRCKGQGHRISRVLVDCDRSVRDNHVIAQIQILIVYSKWRDTYIEMGKFHCAAEHDNLRWNIHSIQISRDRLQFFVKFLRGHESRNEKLKGISKCDWGITSTHGNNNNPHHSEGETDENATIRIPMSTGKEVMQEYV